MGVQWPLNRLQPIVAGEIHHEIPGHGFGIAQVFVNHHALGPAPDIGQAPGRIADGGDPNRSARTETADHPSKALSPIAGTEIASILGLTQDQHFSGMEHKHRDEVTG